jgi:UPF0755 protein
MKRLLKLVAALLLCGLALAAGVWFWLNRPMTLRADHVEVSIEPGTSAREVARMWVEAGVDVAPQLLYQWFRWSGQSRRIRAGSYEVEAGVTPRQLLDRMVRGEETLESLRLIEGWSFRQVRDALNRAPHLRHTIQGLKDAELAEAVGIEAGHVEGWLFPDTYVYSRGVSDLTVLRRAHAAMLERLGQVWATRQGGAQLQEPAQLLVLASIVEKETGMPADRGRIAGVFNNRLRLGMPLQSDPTVIYGLGDQFDGNLRRNDLQTDNPWNTYTRRGLPPTAIAMPGLEALRAAARPDPTPALYFVARGDGSSAFSSTLADHNRAVNQYQRGGGR